MKPRWSLVLFACLALVAARPAEAQGPNTFTVSGLNDLSFGSIIAGSSASVSPSAPGAALFAITGPKHSQVALAFSLPSSLSGPAPLPVSFGSAVWAGQNSPAGAASFNPASGLTLPMPDSRTLYVWLGGSLSTVTSQATGTYSSTVTLSVALN